MNTFNDTLTQEIAAVAARCVVEEGADYGAAKRRAVKQMGLSPRTALPGNDDIECAVRDYLDTFCAETQPAELQALRVHALIWMERLRAFRPHLAGAVWHGTATRLTDIYLQLFCDDAKSAEIALIDHRVHYVARSVSGFNGYVVDCLSVHSYCEPLALDIGVHLMTHATDELRGALRPDAQGRKPRGDEMAVRQLLSGVTDAG